MARKASLEYDLGSLKDLFQKKNAPATPVTLDLVVVNTREEALAIQGLPSQDPPTLERVELQARLWTAAEYMGTSGQ